jgi:hypothetical protein
MAPSLIIKLIFFIAIAILVFYIVTNSQEKKDEES